LAELKAIGLTGQRCLSRLPIPKIWMSSEIEIGIGADPEHLVISDKPGFRKLPGLHFEELGSLKLAVREPIEPVFAGNGRARAGG
jgi:hypothetical protein